MTAMGATRKKTPGFTLLEVLLSVTIFLLLAGGIFAAVSVGIRSSTEIARTGQEADRLDALQRFLRQVFSNLPATARLELRIRPVAGRGDAVELLIWPAPAFTHFSPAAAPSGGLALGAIPDGSGLFSLSLANFGEELPAQNRDEQLQGPDWIAMLPGVRQIRWRFASAENPGLQELWTPANGRPGLANLELFMADGTEKRWQFLIPEIQATREKAQP